MNFDGSRTRNFVGELFLNLIQTQKSSNACLFTLTQTHSMEILGEIPFDKPQNDT